GSVGHHPADYLIGRDPIPYRKNLSRTTMQQCGACGITTRFQELFRSTGQVGHALLTRSPLSPRPKPGIPFDLHVLSTPPAFILSQNRTLHKKTFMKKARKTDSQNKKDEKNPL
ncbi:TolA domain-containing protein, partial [Bifidobacterium myosotis]